MRRIIVSEADRRARASSEQLWRASKWEPQRWDVALIPCTSKKRMGADTALALYDSPRFKAMVMHATQRAERVLIMSAKYGLLDLMDPVSYYDAYLPDLTQEDRDALRERVRCKEVIVGTGGSWPHCRLPRSILSYLPKAYHELLVEAKPAWAPIIRRPYANCTMFNIHRILTNETKHYDKNPARR